MTYLKYFLELKFLNNNVIIWLYNMTLHVHPVSCVLKELWLFSVPVDTKKLILWFSCSQPVMILPYFPFPILSHSPPPTVHSAAIPAPQKKPKNVLSKLPICWETLISSIKDIILFMSYFSCLHTSLSKVQFHCFIHLFIYKTHSENIMEDTMIHKRGYLMYNFGEATLHLTGA